MQHLHPNRCPHPGQIKRSILTPKNRTPTNPANRPGGNHRSSHNPLLLQAGNLILSIRQRARDIRLGAIDREVQAKVAHAGGLGVEDDEEADDGDEGLEVEDDPAQADFVGDVGGGDGGYDGEDVGGRGEELGFGVGEAHAFAEDDGFEEGEGVDGGGGDEVVDGAGGVVRWRWSGVGCWTY